MVEFTIAISSCNRVKYFDEMMTSIFKSLEPCSNYEIIAVDSSNKSGAREYLENLDGVTLYYNKYSGNGESLNHNRKFALAKGKYVFHCCDDYLIENPNNRDWLVDIKAVFENEPTVGIVMNEHRHSGWKYPPEGKFWDELPVKKVGDVEYVILDQDSYRLGKGVLNYPVVGWMYSKDAFEKIGEFQGQGYKNWLQCDYYHVLKMKEVGLKFAVILNSATTKHLGIESNY